MPKVTLDWKAYFNEFCEVHGGEPVVYKERLLLFRDGWRYSAKDRRGPEFPPPKDEEEHKQWIRTYWEIKKAVLETELRELKRSIQDLVTAQRTRTTPLFRKVIIEEKDEDTGRVKRRRGESAPIDLELMLIDAEALTDSVNECNEELKDIKIPEMPNLISTSEHLQRLIELETRNDSERSRNDVF